VDVVPRCKDDPMARHGAKRPPKADLDVSDSEGDHS
jgi:hypothetical protein